MARGSARTGKIMIDASAGANGSATVFNFTKTWSVDRAQPNFIDVTSLGDSQENTVAGLPGSYTITIDGFTDIGSTAADAITDGQSRKTYIYKDFTNSPTVGYWFGNVAYGGSASGDVTDALKQSLSGKSILSGTWL